MDYIITRGSSCGIAGRLDRSWDELADFLEEIRQKGRYHRWMFGHCHGDMEIEAV